MIHDNYNKIIFLSIFFVWKNIAGTRNNVNEKYVNLWTSHRWQWPLHHQWNLPTSFFGDNCRRTTVTLLRIWTLHNQTWCNVLTFIRGVLPKKKPITQGRFPLLLIFVFHERSPEDPTLSQRLYLALSLPRVINVKFPLKPHRKHNITV